MESDSDNSDTDGEQKNNSKYLPYFRYFLQSIRLRFYFIQANNMDRKLLDFNFRILPIITIIFYIILCFL